MKEFIEKYGVYVLAFFLLILGLFYYGKSYACDNFAYDSQNKIYFFEHPLAIKHMNLYLNKKLRNCAALALADCKTNAQKVNFHKQNAERCFEDAKKRCWWLPDLSHRDKAKYCFTNIGVLISPGDPRSKLVIAIISTLVQYGIDCNDEWDYIDDKLHWSQYHYEMMEFYQGLIKQGKK